MSATAEKRIGNTTSDVADFDDIKRDIAELKGDLARLASDTASTGMAAVKDGACVAKDAISDISERTGERASAAHQTLGDSVSKRPVTSLAIAFGAGAILSRLMRK